jgi:hypothetical protein
MKVNNIFIIFLLNRLYFYKKIYITYIFISKKILRVFMTSCYLIHITVFEKREGNNFDSTDK